MRLTLIVVAILSLLPHATHAQPADDARRQTDCRLAIQIITTGQPAGKASWAAYEIGTCGAAAGTAVAGAIRASRTSRDMAALSRLGDVAVVLWDGAMFQAATDVLADLRASPEARLVAARVLVLGLQPGLYMTYAQLADGNCYGTFRGGDSSPMRRGASIGPDLTERARVVGGQVQSDSTAPRTVRLAAGCVFTHKAAPFREPPDGPDYVIVVQNLTITYLCGNTFRIHNPYLVDMPIQYGVERSRRFGTTVVPAESDKVLTSTEPGTLQIRYEDGELIASARNEGRACTP